MVLRPKCANCGKRIYLSASWRIPSYCPRCGKEISSNKRRDIVGHEIKFCCLSCILFFAILIIVIAIAMNYANLS